MKIEQELYTAVIIFSDILAERIAAQIKKHPYADLQEPMLRITQAVEWLRTLGEMQASKEVRLLCAAEVSKKVGLSRVSLWRLERNGLFPKKRRIVGGSVRWLSSEVDAWLHSRPTS